MTARFIYANTPLVYHQNGLQMDKNERPKDSLTKLFINNLIGGFLLRNNPANKHKCTSLCGQPTQFMMGFPHSSEVKSSVEPSLRQMVEDYEELIETVAYEGTENVEIQTLCVRMLPCSLYPEILDAAIYL